jgi:two-component sensor histidine kinase
VGLLLLLLLLLAAGSGRVAAQTTEPSGAPTRTADSLRRAPFYRLLAIGDSVYAQRKGYESIAGSLRYFNRAYALAQHSRDTLLLAEAVFAKGRVYDAWNKAPHQTIRHFEQAVALFGRLPGARWRYYYARYLLVHAHDKVPDTVGTMRAARALYRVLRAQPDSVLRQVPTTVELAWSCTEVGAYALADSVLRHLTHRARIVNDPTSYDHLTHYYLVRARLDLLAHRRPTSSAYLDSLDAAYQRATNIFDRLYYGQQLARLYAAAQQYPVAYGFLAEASRLGDSIANKGEVARLRQDFLQSEQRAEQVRRQQDAAARTNRFRVLWSLAAGLLILALVSAHLARQNRLVRLQAALLTRANHALDDKVAQVELLNKEIQHRVKNNLHMIFSLLQMQERQTDNAEVIEHLQTARLRVESIATLHNQLLRDAGGLDLGPYLRGLISGVVGCLANDKQVVTHLQTDVLHLPERAYLPLSLILNEWVTNSIKYAEPTAGPLEISVIVRRQPATVCIQYHDNGARATGTHAPGLGTQIIRLLTRQLGATAVPTPGQPYHYELCIPHDQPAGTVA